MADFQLLERPQKKMLLKQNLFISSTGLQENTTLVVLIVSGNDEVKVWTGCFVKQVCLGGSMWNWAEFIF
jgi:hypothetical protein